eukprot:3902866-Pyramimonas_sp.AAC.1
MPCFCTQRATRLKGPKRRWMLAWKQQQGERSTRPRGGKTIGLQCYSTHAPNSCWSCGPLPTPPHSQNMDMHVEHNEHDDDVR